MQLVASHIKNHVEPVEKYFEKNMEKRQKVLYINILIYNNKN